ncbi:MAG: aldehyde dehydrogenase family protein, partial [Gammaproteobacteria bacterium]
MSSSLSDMKRIFDLQQQHQWNMKASSADERKTLLSQLRDAVKAHGDEIIEAVKKDTRKPEMEVGITEVANVVANIDRNINNLDEWMRPLDVPSSLDPDDSAQILYEARGVCLILGPWNFPLGLVFGPLAAAVAAGNCCMVKLTDLCPNTARV